MNKIGNLFAAIFLVSIACFFAGCNHQAARQTPYRHADSKMESRVKDETAVWEVQNRVEEIYNFICKQYNDAKANVPDRSKFQKFCSSAWNAQAAAVDRIDAKHVGEIGLWDYDYWIQGQDWDSVSYKNVKVMDIVDGRTAHVELILHNMQDNLIGLTLIKERGKWFIDDLIDEPNPHGIRKTQAKYIKEN